MEKLKNSNNKFIQLVLNLLEKNYQHKLSEKSAVITYYLLLSIGPFLILLFSILSYILVDNIDAVTEFARGISDAADTVIEPVVEHLKNTNTTTFAVIGGLATLFSSSKSSKFIISSFNELFGVEEETGIKAMILTNIYSMIFTLALVISLVVFFVFFVTGDPIAWLVNYLFGIDLSSIFLWNFLRNFIPIIYLFVFLTIIFKLLSKFNKDLEITLREAFIGAAFVTVGWIGGSLLFQFYVNNFNANNAIYGALGSIMVIMLWFYLLIYMLLLGAALIVSYTEVFKGKIKPNQDFDELKTPFEKKVKRDEISGIEG